MPVKCYYKPNRSKPRPFTPRDLSRIACRLRDTGDFSQNEILQGVLDCVGAEVCEKLGEITNRLTNKVNQIVAQTVNPVGNAIETISSILENLEGNLLRIPILGGTLAGRVRRLRVRFDELNLTLADLQSEILGVNDLILTLRSQICRATKEALKLPSVRK